MNRIAVTIVLLLLVCASGCFSPFRPVVRPEGESGAATNTTAGLETIMPEIPDTTVAVPTGTTLLPVTTATPLPESDQVLVNETNSLTIDEYRDYKFQDFGYDFLYPGDRFRFSITSEKPVMVYVVGYMDSLRIQASDGIPHYETGDSKLQWGSVNPAFSWELVSDRIATFTIEDVGQYSFVVDPRWMTYDEKWFTKRPFDYRLKIERL